MRSLYDFIVEYERTLHFHLPNEIRVSRIDEAKSYRIRISVRMQNMLYNYTAKWPYVHSTRKEREQQIKHWKCEIKKKYVLHNWIEKGSKLRMLFDSQALVGVERQDETRPTALAQLTLKNRRRTSQNTSCGRSLRRLRHRTFYTRVWGTRNGRFHRTCQCRRRLGAACCAVETGTTDGCAGLVASCFGSRMNMFWWAS